MKLFSVVSEDNSDELFEKDLFIIQNFKFKMRQKNKGIKFLLMVFRKHLKFLFIKLTNEKVYFKFVR